MNRRASSTTRVVNVVETVAKGSSRFNKQDFEVVESKDTPRGSAPAPKADSGGGCRSSIFNCIRFKKMWRASCAEWNPMECGSFRQLQIHLQRRGRDRQTILTKALQVR